MIENIEQKTHGAYGAGAGMAAMSAGDGDSFTVIYQDGKNMVNSDFHGEEGKKEFIEKLTHGIIGGKVTVVGANLGEIKFDKDSGETNEWGDELPAVASLDITFNNCKIKNLEAYDGRLHLTLNDSIIETTYFETVRLAISGENSEIKHLGMNEGSLNLADMKNINLPDISAGKVHVSGKMTGGKFVFEDGSRVWLGQNDDLIMDGVNFGQADYDPDYFTNDHDAGHIRYLTLINPKMNPKTLSAIRKISPEILEAPAQDGAEKIDRQKETLVAKFGKPMFERLGQEADAAQKIAEQVYDEVLAAQGFIDQNNYSTELLDYVIGKKKIPEVQLNKTEKFQLATSGVEKIKQDLITKGAQAAISPMVDTQKADRIAKDVYNDMTEDGKDINEAEYIQAIRDYIANQYD